MPGPAVDERVTVVVATRDRRAELERTLVELAALEPRPRVVVVDNASCDGTTAFVRARFPGVEAVRLPRNRGAAARNAGAALASTPYVAFSDDDSWWEPGALTAAADALDADPGLGLVAAAIMVGPEHRPDPVNEALAQGIPPEGPEPPGPRVLGFLGCAAVVRAEAFAQVGGYSALLFLVGEEALLAQDLAAAGWGLRHVPESRAVHHPSRHRPPSPVRLRQEMRNRLLIALMRRPVRRAAREAAGLARSALHRPEARGAIADAVRAAPRALGLRARVPDAVERDLCALEDR